VCERVLGLVFLFNLLNKRTKPRLFFCVFACKYAKGQSDNRRASVLGCSSTSESGFHGGKTKFCQSENGANETGNGSHGGLSASALKRPEFHDHAQGFTWMPQYTREWFSRR
jgi:hypothetical protein